MAEFAISLARQADCLPLAELSRVAIEYGLRWRWKPSRVQALIKSPDASVIVASDSEQSLLGFAAMEFRETHAHLLLLATHSRYRRAGIGSKLLGWLEASASVAGLDHIDLEVRVENGAAVKFYEHHGYAVEQVKAGYYQGIEDAYLMRHDLIDREIARRRP